MACSSPPSASRCAPCGTATLEARLVVPNVSLGPAPLTGEPPPPRRDRSAIRGPIQLVPRFQERCSNGQRTEKEQCDQEEAVAIAPTVTRYCTGYESASEPPQDWAQDDEGNDNARCVAE